MKKNNGILKQVYNGVRTGLIIGFTLTAIVIIVAAGIDAIVFNNEDMFMWYSLMAMILLILMLCACIILDGIIKDIMYFIEECKK